MNEPEMICVLHDLISNDNCLGIECSLFKGNVCSYMVFQTKVPALVLIVGFPSLWGSPPSLRPHI